VKLRSSLWQRLDQLADEDAAGDKQVSIERETIRRQLKELEEPSTIQTSGQEMVRLSAQFSYITDALRPVRRNLSIRFWGEMLFPTCLGALAILGALFLP
jgi:hypothetical protein